MNFLSATSLGSAEAGTKSYWCRITLVDRMQNSEPEKPIDQHRLIEAFGNLAKTRKNARCRLLTQNRVAASKHLFVDGSIGDARCEKGCMSVEAVGDHGPQTKQAILRRFTSMYSLTRKMTRNIKSLLSPPTIPVGLCLCLSGHLFSEELQQASTEVCCCSCCWSCRVCLPSTARLANTSVSVHADDALSMLRSDFQFGA